MIGLVVVGLLSAWQASSNVGGGSIKEVKTLAPEKINQVIIVGPVVANVHLGQEKKPQLTIIRKTDDTLEVSQVADTLTVTYKKPVFSQWGEYNTVSLDIALPSATIIQVSHRANVNLFSDHSKKLNVSADNRSLVSVKGAVNALVATVNNRSQISVVPELQSLTVLAMNRSMLSAQVTKDLTIKALNRSILNIKGEARDVNVVLKNRSLLNGADLAVINGVVDVHNRSLMTLASVDHVKPQVDTNSSLSILDK